uniref:Uncharacterized protein n=1 Tax=Ditylenchus dipsaci TaxID=166011 RepID=A0A915EDY2_9BILA
MNYVCRNSGSPLFSTIRYGSPQPDYFRWTHNQSDHCTHSLAFLLLCYGNGSMTLDATDGKQARRTNSSSPLGELFDHGCDSCSQVLVTLNICYAMQLGTDRYMVLLVSVVAVLLFYCAHWATYCTDDCYWRPPHYCTFRTRSLEYRVVWCQTEGFSSVYLWSLVLLQFGGYLKIVLSEGVGKNGSTVAGTSVLFPLFPLLAICLPFVMVYSKSTSGIYDQHITLFCMCFGAVAAKATNRLIIAHMSRSELELWDWIYLSPLVMMFNQYYDFHFDEYKLLMYSTIYAYISLFVFCIFICHAPSQTPSTSSAHTRQLSQSSKEHLSKSK